MDQPSSTESNAITLRIRFKSGSLDEFIMRYGADVSPGGIFIRTKQPIEVGTTLQFDFSLADGSPLLTGMGTVAWVREGDPARANNVPGMGLRFDKLTAESQHTHQLILAEKARQEGKASSTPYPPTAFVAPPVRNSPPPEMSKPAATPPAQPILGPSNFAVTRPAPATVVANLLTPEPASAVVQSPGSFSDTEEFSEGGKTEVSDRPLDYYVKGAEAHAANEALQGRRQEFKTSEEAVPQSLLEDFSTGAPSTPVTQSGPSPEGLAAAERELGFMERSVASESEDFARPSRNGEVSAAVVDLGVAGKVVGDSTAVPSGEVLLELSAGAPIEETVSETTEQVLTPPASEPIQVPSPVDLGTGLETGFGDDRPPSGDYVVAHRPKGAGKSVAIIAVAVAAAAFGAVYLAKAKPWQGQARTAVPVATPPAESPPPPVPVPAAEPAPSKPAVAEVLAAEHPAGEELKPVVAVAGKGEEKKAEKATEKDEQNDPAAEKALAKGGRESAKSSGKSPEKTGAKSDENSSGAVDDEVYRLVVRSAPISAEVLIDGEYFNRTPCEHRILDPTVSFSIVVRKEGYEPYERLVGPSDRWVKKGEERVLTVTASLKRAKRAEASTGPAPVAASPESRPERWGDLPGAKPEPSEAGKAAVIKAAPVPGTEAARPAVKESAKAESGAKPEPAKTAAPAEKGASKPAPSFDDPGKAKE